MVFHCQQAVEKSFKASLTFHDQPFRKTHSLEEIGEAYFNIGVRLRDLVANPDS
jgi:HEPN domain-containing protein